MGFKLLKLREQKLGRKGTQKEEVDCITMMYVLSPAVKIGMGKSYFLALSVGLVL